MRKVRKNAFSSSLGNTDLVCYFLLRASELLSESGYFGLIATNSISQGDNRASTLVPLTCERIIHWVNSQFDLAGHSKSLRLVAWTCTAEFRWQRFRLDDGTSNVHQQLPNRRVFPSRCRGVEIKLWASLSRALSSSETASQLDSEAGTVLFSKYSERSDCQAVAKRKRLGLDGANLPRRYAIDFADMSMREAQRYEECFTIQSRRRSGCHEAKNKRKARRERWWQHGEKAMGMRRAIAGG